MTQCIKCGRNIPDGELFCAQCSKLPVIEELNNVTLHPMADGRRNDKKVKKPAPRMEYEAPKKPANGQTKLKRPFVVVCVLLVLCIGLLVWQQIDLSSEQHKLWNQQMQLERDRAAMEETDRLYAETKLALQEAQQLLLDKEEELTELSTLLAQSQSSQNQGQYDLEQLTAKLTTLQEEYDTLKEDHDTMVAAVEAAAKFKEKAQFLDKYVVFVEDNGTRLYHKYDCADFAGSSFWTYSPKLAQAQGFSACPKCN